MDTYGKIENLELFPPLILTLLFSNIRFIIFNCLNNITQIYHVWEGYLRKIPVDRRKISRAEWRGKFSLKGNFSSLDWYFLQIPPLPNMIYLFNYTEYYLEHWLNK